MNSLVLLKNDEAFTSSIVIAEGTGNEHRAVRRIIEKYENDLNDFGKVCILNAPLRTKGGVQEISYYELNEEQATFLMTLLRNSKKVVQFKKELVRQFYKMRKFILEKQSTQWLDTRYQGKLTRKAETDTIKQLVEYAKEQGSTNSDRLYMVYSKLANKVAGVEKRDIATISQLNNLNLIENIILHSIENGIISDKHYKEIYQDCKKRLELFKDLAYLEKAV